MRTPKTDVRKSEVRAVLEKFTPGRAREILLAQPALWAARSSESEVYKKNRQIKKSTVETLCRQMVSKQWVFNGDTLKFADDGRLLDGQHRLTALVESGMTFEFLVVYGLDPVTVFPIIDGGGRKRAPSDLLEMMGKENCKRLAAALRCVFVYKTNPKISALGGGSVGLDDTGKNRNQQVLELVTMYPDMTNVIDCGISRNVPVLQEAITNACYYLFREKDPTLAEVFMDNLASGTGLKKGDPIHTLREKLIRQKSVKTSTHQWNRGFAMMLVIYAWNAVREGRKLDRFCPKMDGSLPVIE